MVEVYVRQENAAEVGKFHVAGGERFFEVGQGRGRTALDKYGAVSCFHHKNSDGVFQFEEQKVEGVDMWHVRILKWRCEDNGFGRWGSCRIICNFAGLIYFVP